MFDAGRKVPVPAPSGFARQQMAAGGARGYSAVIGNPPGRCALLREQVMDDPARLRQSVRELLALDFETLLVGDGALILPDAAARLREPVDTFPD